MIGKTFEQNGKTVWASDPDTYDKVAPWCVCPKCGEDHMYSLAWDDMDFVHCATCGKVYDPAEQADVERH